MGRELPSLCQVETQRLLWLMVATFALFITFQYLELPYGISYLFSAYKIPVATRNGTLEADPPLSSIKSLDNNVPNTTNIMNSTDSFLDPAPASEEKKADVDNNTRPMPNDDMNRFNETGDPENVSLNGTSGNSTSALAPEIAENDQNFAPKNYTTVGNDSEEDGDEENVDTILENKGNPNASYGSSSSSPTIVPINTLLPRETDTKANATVASTGYNASSGEKDLSLPSIEKNGRREESQNTSTKSGDNTCVAVVPNSGVVSISKMNELLRCASHRSKRPRWPSEVDEQLLYAKTQIENAPTFEKDPVLDASLYRNVSKFKRSYELMEKMLKVYIYKEGKRPIMHTPVLKGIYASEGWFMKLLESNKDFVTKIGKKAHLFYLPFSSRMLEETLYVKDSHSHKNLIQYLEDYLDLILAKYPFWNRTSGADHFLVACHDWAPTETRKYMANCIRALCNSDIKEGYVFGKDVALPETNVRNAQKPLKDLGGKPASKRPTLAFFAGKMHGYLRPILLSYWGDNKDPDMKIFGRLPRSKGNKNYLQFMKTSKYCICAKGYEVNSPRVVEAIFFECVPVIISDNFVPPFFEILNWESFAVFVLEKDIPNLKNILLSIPERRYREMQMRVKKVQKHFLWHTKPEKYDIFHMILHSVWYNRVFQI